MRFLLLDTNIVSVLFKPDHPLKSKCVETIGGAEWFISFMTRGELLLWPRVNHWGSARREDLLLHIGLCTTLHADERTCELWADITAESRAVGRPITTADAWVAATARRWDIALVTTDYRDFEHLDDLTIISIS